MQISAYEGTKINTEVNERVLKNISDKAYRFERVPIFLSLAKLSVTIFVDEVKCLLPNDAVWDAVMCIVPVCCVQ